MERTYIKNLKPGKNVFLKGWIYEIRELAKMKFLLLRDSSGFVQCVIKGELVSKAFDLTLESVVEILGNVKKADVKAEFARQDIEIEVIKLEILNSAEKLPIQVNEKTVSSELPIRLDYRSLDIRKPRVKAIFKIQSTILNSFREYFYKKEFIEIQPPGIISTSTEGGTDLFEIKYFDRKAYLAQSPQLYKQMLACSLEKVFTITPVWRAEKHNTIRHLNESRQMDIEMAFSGQKEVMLQLEKAVQYIVSNVLKKCEKELELLNLKLKVPKSVYLS